MRIIKKVSNLLDNKLMLVIIVLFILSLAVISYVSYNKYLTRGTTDAKYFEFNSESGTITGYYNDKLKDVVIPSRINGKEVKAIGDDAFIMEDLTSVVIPNTVTKIGVEAFANNKLTSVTIPSSVTYIGKLAFLDNSLTNLKIPAGVKTIGAGAFNRNKLPDDQAFVYAIDYNGNIDYTTIVSYGGINKTITIPTGVAFIPQLAFAYNDITSVVIPESVIAIQHEAFLNSPITSVTIQGNDKQRFNENWYDIGFNTARRP